MTDTIDHDDPTTEERSDYILEVESEYLAELQAEREAARAARIAARVQGGTVALEARLRAAAKARTAESDALDAAILTGFVAAQDAALEARLATNHEVVQGSVEVATEEAFKPANADRLWEISHLANRGCYDQFSPGEGVSWDPAWAADVTDEELDRMRLVARVADSIREARDAVRPGFPWGWATFIRPVLEGHRLVDLENAAVEAEVWMGDQDELVIEPPVAPEGYAAGPLSHTFVGSPEEEATALVAALVGWLKRPSAPTPEMAGDVYLDRIPF